MEASSNVGSNNNNVHTVKCGVPQLTCLDDFCQFGYNPKRDKLMTEVSDWVTLNPNTEHIYKFELSYNDTTNMTAANSWLKNCSRSLETGEQMNCVVAGSYALWVLDMMFNGYAQPNWKANDIDMFLMNRQQHARHSPSGGLLDIVHTTDKTPEEVITNFDIPCCRVAFDMNFTFYASIHAIYAMNTRTIRLPRYLKDRVSFKTVLNKYNLENPPKDVDGRVIRQYHDKLVDRMAERIKKYQSRGFSFQWYDSEYILPWIRQRFAYVDFDMLKPSSVVVSPVAIMTKDGLYKELDRGFIFNNKLHIVSIEDEYGNRRSLTNDEKEYAKQRNWVVMDNGSDSVTTIDSIIDHDKDIQRKLNIIETLEDMAKKYPDEYIPAVERHKAELRKLFEWKSKGKEELNE